MTITTLQVQGSDAAKKTVPLDTPTGKTYSAPIHKVGFGAESALSLVSNDNPLPVTSTGQTTGNEILAEIEANQTNGSQKVQIVDNAGNSIGSDEHDGGTHILTDSLDHYTTGTISTLGGSVELDVHGIGSAIVTVGGTWTGKLDVQGTIDSVNWVTLSIMQPTGLLIRTGINNDAQNGSYRVAIVAAYSKIRVVATTFTSGSVSVKMNAAHPVGTNLVWQLNAANLNATVTGSGAAGTPAAGVVTVQGISGGTTVPVSGTIAVSGVSTAANQTEMISNVGDVTDAKVQSDTNGTILGFLRGIVSWFAEVVGTVVQTPTQTKAIRVQIGPGDVISYLPVFVDYPHHQVHEGEAFIFSDLQTAGLNIAATRDIRISVGALEATTRTPHLLIEFIADALAEIELYEGTTWTSGGTAQVGYNRNRNVADDSGTLYVNGATALTVNAIGTPIWRGMTTGAKNSAGGTDRGAYEFVLKTSTEYCVRVTSRTTGLKFLTRLEYYKDLGV